MYLFIYRTLLCGNHECDLICHAGDCKTCETLPEVVTHCPCGATPLSEQTKTTRLSCLDPVPTCEKICNKPLGCGPTGKEIIRYCIHKLIIPF